MAPDEGAPEVLHWDAAFKRYHELLSEKASLSENLKWLHANLPVLKGEVSGGEDDVEGSDLLFLADYANLERHIHVKGIESAKCNGGPSLELVVQQRMEKMSSVLWPSGCVLAEVVVQELRDTCSRGAAILELGCGTAVPSIVAAFLGAQVLATDADVAPAELVIARNIGVLAAVGGSVSTSRLVWGAAVPPRPWAAVLVADAIYDEEGHAALAATLASVPQIAREAGNTEAPRILLAFQRRKRAVEDRFFHTRLPEVGLTFRQLSVASIPLSETMRSCIRVVEVVVAAEGPRATNPDTVAVPVATGLYL